MGGRFNWPRSGKFRTAIYFFQLPYVIDEDNVELEAALALEVLSRDPDPDTRYRALHALIERAVTFERSWLEGIAARLVQDPDQQIRELALNFRPGSAVDSKVQEV